MSYFFIRGMLEGVNRKMGNLLYVRVVDNEIVEIHDKKTKHLVVLKVIATHLVKGKLGLEDIVAEIQDDEAMVDELDHAEPCLWQALDVLLSELVGLDVHDQLVDVPAVKRYDILLNELFLRIVEFAVSALLPPLLVLLLLTRPNHIVFNLLRKQSRELLVEDLADDAMCNNQTLNALHFTATSDLFENDADQLLPFLLVLVLPPAFLASVADVYADLIVRIVIYIDIDVNIFALPLEGPTQKLVGQVHDALRKHHFMRFIDVGVDEGLLNKGGAEEPLHHLLPYYYKLQWPGKKVGVCYQKPVSTQDNSIYGLLLNQVQQFYCHPMTSFILSNLNLQAKGAKFGRQSKKIFKIEVADNNTQTISIVKLKPAQIVSEWSLQWQQQIVLPSIFDTAYPFEIQNQYEGKAGYNPEDIDSTLEGNILIKATDKVYCCFQVQAKGKRVGFLYANLQLPPKQVKPKKMIIEKPIENSSSFFGKTINVEDDSIVVLSLYANFHLLDFIEKSRVYLQFEIGETVERSAIKKVSQAEYRSNQVMQIKHTDQSSSKLIVSAFTFQPHVNKITKIGSGFTNLIIKQDNPNLKMEERVKIERIFLYNKEEEQIGWVSFKYIKSKQKNLDPRYFLQDKFNTIGDVNFRPLKNASFTITDRQTTPIIMSGLQSNHRIYIPRSQRFENPSKKKACEQIGIAHQSVDLKDFPTTRKYKFASFGLGSRILGVERDRDIPGTGRYILPSLFDRFK